MSRYRKRGDPTGEWRVKRALEPHEDVPPDAVILDAGLSLAEESQKHASSDPYNRITSPALPTADPGKRRSLDDMRHLSHAIKSAKTWEPPQRSQSGGAGVTVAKLRADLARMVAEVAPLTRSDAEPEHPHARRALQFRNFAAQLQHLLDCLLKMEAD